MKKALALILALVLALSMAVSAFALELVTLNPTATASASLIPVTELNLDAYNEAYVVAGEGGTYYVLLDNADYKNIEVTSSGVATAKVVKYDPTVYAYVDKIPYVIYNRVTGDEHSEATLMADAAKLVAAASYYDEAKTQWKAGYTYTAAGELVYITVAKDGTTKSTHVYGQYKHMCAVADILNEANGYKELAVRTNVENLEMIEIEVGENYSASYKEGMVKISATLDKKPVSAKLAVIRDVVIADYETVKWAGAYGKVLALGVGEGYSDYKSFVNGYNEVKLNDAAIKANNPVVVSTTAFRAIEGDALTVTNTGLTVEIEEVQAAQKGVNFERLAGNGWNKIDKGGVVEVYDAALFAKYGADEAIFEKLEFGFYGEQVVKGDFTISVELPYNFFQLRELFGVKVEEDDIVTYYLLKDGKVAQEIVVDYMAIDPYKSAEIEINLADTTLGQYELVLEVESAAEVGGEENPNTGAESVVGIVAALAVVSVATAAAVSLKK